MMKFTTNITRDSNSDWKCAIWKDSVTEMGTGKAVKVKAQIDGHEFLATFLPIGGMHMLPLRSAILKSIKKDVGDSITVSVEILK